MSDNTQAKMEELALAVKQAVDNFLDATDHEILPMVEVKFKTASQIGRPMFLTQVSIVAEMRAEI